MSEQKEPTEFIARPEAQIVNAYTQGSFTMIPGKAVVFLRGFLLWQLVRFLVINLRMTVMIVKSHK